MIVIPTEGFSREWRDMLSPGEQQVPRLAADALARDDNFNTTSLSQVRRQLRARHLHLFSAGEILHRELLCRHFVFADNHDESRPSFLGALE